MTLKESNANKSIQNIIHLIKVKGVYLVTRIPPPLGIKNVHLNFIWEVFTLSNTFKQKLHLSFLI